MLCVVKMGLNRTPSKKMQIRNCEEPNGAHASSAMGNNENEQMMNEKCPICFLQKNSRK